MRRPENRPKAVGPCLATSFGSKQAGRKPCERRFYTTRNDRPRTNGGEYGAAPVKPKAPVCCLQSIAQTGSGVSASGRNRIGLAGRFCKTARETTNDLVDGTGRR